MGLLASDKAQWKLVGSGLRHVRAQLGPDTALGRRRSIFADAPQIDTEAALEAMIVAGKVLEQVATHQWDGHPHGAVGPYPLVAETLRKAG